MIETDRLYLRPLHMGNESFISSMMRNPSVYKYILKQEPWPDSKIYRLLSSQQDLFVRTGYCLFGVEMKATRTLTGYCGLQPLEDFSGTFCNEVGASWAFHEKYWGAGLATESAAAVLDQAFKYTSLRNIKALIHPANRGSMRVARKVGFEFEDIVFRNNRLRLMYSAFDPAYRRSISFDPTRLTKTHPADMLNFRLA